MCFYLTNGEQTVIIEAGVMKMRVIESCAECLYNRQLRLTDNQAYLAEIRDIIDNRGQDATAPYLVYRFNQTYRKYFGRTVSYADVKKQYNDLVLSMEDALRGKINQSEHPLLTAFSYARAGNYIDFGAIRQVDEKTFLSLLERDEFSEHDLRTFDSFTAQCANADSLLLLADNSGEIVLDKLFLEQLGQQYPQMKRAVLVRGGEVLNDATVEDALYAGIDSVAEIVSSGVPVSGTVYDMMSDEAKNAIDCADVILAKGQGNYEALSGQGRHIFYSFLCKCERFTNRFQVPEFTGMFIEEDRNTCSERADDNDSERVHDAEQG